MIENYYHYKWKTCKSDEWDENYNMENVEISGKRFWKIRRNKQQQKAMFPTNWSFNENNQKKLYFVEVSIVQAKLIAMSIQKLGECFFAVWEEL